MKQFTKILLIALIVCATVACNDKKGEFALRVKYLPVKLVNSQKWSIVDLSSGEVIARDTFAMQPSAIVNDLFYVPNDDGTYSYYSVHDLSKPVSDTRWGSVTVFSDDGYAVASRRGGPLCVINKKCEVVKELPRDVVACSMFTNGRAIFRTEQEMAGYIDVKGDSVIPAQYAAANAFLHGDAAIVTRSVGDSAFDITAIDRRGKELFSVSSLEYGLLTPYFSLGAIAMQHADSVVFLDRSGHETENPDKNYARVSKLGYAQVITSPSMTYIVTDKKGRQGVVNAEGKVLIPVKYDKVGNIAPNRYLVLTDSVASIVDSRNAAVGKARFTQFQAGPSDIFAIRGFIDTSIAAAQFLQMVAPEYCAGALAGSTLMDLNVLVGDNPAPFVGLNSVPHSEGSFVIFYYFDRDIASAPKGGAPQFNYDARLVSVSVSSNVSHCGLNTEQEVLDKIKGNLGSRGFVFAKDDVFVSQPGTTLALGYNRGMLNMFYFVNPALTQPLPHVARK